MKLSAPILLSYCLLLTVVGSCKKPALEEPEPNLANCRIVKEIYQVGWRPEATSTKETVHVDGTSYDVMLARESTFSYDTQGRIIKEEHKLAPYFTPGINYTITYAYTPAAVFKRSLSARWDERDTIRLNQQGLISQYAGLSRYYDDEGYAKYAISLLGNRKLQWMYDTLKNTVKIQTIDPYEARTQTYLYDIEKKKVPNRYPFYGKIGPNLCTKYTFQVDKSTAFPTGILVAIDYRYTFDKYERVSREIAIETHFVPPQQYGQYIYAGGVGVTDYQYDCP